MEKRKFIGLYPGTFDPITFGHSDLIERAALLVDELVVGVASNPKKEPLFSLDERTDMVEGDVAALMVKRPELAGKIRVLSFDNLLMNFAVSLGAKAVIRGLRAVSDFEYEFQMAMMNRRICSDVQTIFLPASDHYQFISSTLVKEVGRLDGSILPFVSDHVARKIEEKKKRNKQI